MPRGHPLALTDDDIEDILDRIESGESQSEIAQTIGCNVSALNRRLRANPDIEQRSARVMESSAEAWLDRGLGTIASALSKDSGIDATAARAYAQECARRAAIRNPRYRDKVDHQHSGTVRQVHELSTDELLRIAAQDSRPDVPLVERLDD